mgnify:CR=1 FL=1
MLFNLLRKTYQFLMTFMKDIGGLKSLFLKTIKEFRENGISGILTKTKHFLYHLNLHSKTNRKKNNYKVWLKLYNKPSSKKRMKMIDLINTFSFSPKFSIIMPTYNSNITWLKKATESANNQIYTNWELCIADDSSSDSRCIEELKYYEKTNNRINVVFREKNGHISEASNSAIKIATGDWIILLDHDDLLSDDALFWLAYTINKNPKACLIYSDEDKIDSHGNHSEPYFKCDWNYDLFLSQNMINHLGAYKLNIVNKIGGFRKGFEGSQDYDLALRFIEQINEDQIVHIPRILYHWRIHKDSTAEISNIKPYAFTAAQTAIKEHLLRKEVKADVNILENNMYRVKYHLPEDIPGVSIIIPTYNNYKMLKTCIDSILAKTNYPEYEIIIINNNSDDKYTLQYFNSLSDISNIKIIDDSREFNFSSINNRAVEHVSNEYICFLNDDIEVITPDWLSEMISFSIQSRVGAVGAKLWYFNETLQHGGIITGIGGVAGHSHKYLPKGNEGYFCRANIIQSLSAVTAACMVVSKSIFEEVKGFNESDLSIAFNDVDLCLKIQKLGYINIWTPYAELYHHESASRGKEDSKLKQIRFSKEIEYMKDTWMKQIYNDPAYSPNLSINDEDFSLAWPPRTTISMD